MDEGTTSNLATLRDFKEGLESLLRELREVIKDNQENAGEQTFNRLWSQLSKDNLSCDDNQCLGDENDTDVVSENKKIRALVNMGYGIDGSKVNSSANGIEEVSDC
ncbi:hypothetical protein Tco_1389837, partial [Tanacetum coccineum]